jgi:hypothetical protein
MENTSKAYRIYIPGHRKVEINRDVTFDENATFSKSKQIRAEEAHEEENEVPKVPEAVEPEEVIPEDHDMVEPQKPPRYLLAREDQLGHKSLSEMQKELVPQRNISGKVRSRSRIPATWHACVT